MPVNNHIADLINKHLQETITEDEQNILNEWIGADDDHRAMFDRFTNNDSLHQDLVAHGETDQRIKEQVYAQLPEVQDALTIVPKRRWMRYASIAAAILVIGFLSIWYMLPKTSKTGVVPEQQTPVATVIPAGGNKATLTLADGTIVDLGKVANGEIAKQGKTAVTKKEEGQLEYRSANGSYQSEVTYNVLNTPRGGQYQLLLPDGSKVWLNAASSIRYPTAFVGERRVEVSGELYFEVKSDASKPFIVTIQGRGGEVIVTGTRFNVNAYGDEGSIKTTLLEGKVNVRSDKTMLNLKPGQQASLYKQTQQINKLNDVDVDEAVAWKNGYFQFNSADIQTVLRNLERWYDVDVKYQGILPQRTFGGKISRENNLSQVLKILESNGVHFKIDGKKIIVSP